MSGWIVLAAWVLLALVVGRVVAGLIRHANATRWSFIGNRLEGTDYLMVGLAMVFAPLALAAAPVAGMVWVVTRPPRAERLKARRDALDRRITELERDLDIR